MEALFDTQPFQDSQGDENLASAWHEGFLDKVLESSKLPHRWGPVELNPVPESAFLPANFA